MPKLKVAVSGAAPADVKKLVRTCAQSAFKSFGYDFDGEMGVRFVSPAEIRALNAEYRGKDKETDVLSFPMCDFYRGEATITDADRDMDTGRVYLGDTVISLSQAEAQAGEFGHGLARECGYLTVHSVLHLLGFDHEDEGAEKTVMRRKEEEILKTLGLERKDND